MPDRNYEQAADELGLKASWLRAQVQARQIPHRRYGRLVRFTDADLDAIRARFAEPVLDLRTAGILRRVA